MKKELASGTRKHERAEALMMKSLMESLCGFASSLDSSATMELSFSRTLKMKEGD
jgi:hypothetical protein